MSGAAGARVGAPRWIMNKLMTFQASPTAALSASTLSDLQRQPDQL